MLTFHKSYPVAADEPLSLRKNRRSRVYPSNFAFGGTETTKVVKPTLKNLSFRQMDAIYRRNDWVRACVDRIVDTVVDIPPIVKALKIDTKTGLSDDTKRNMEKLEEWLIRPNSQFQTLDSLRKQVYRDILIYDAGAVELAQSKSVTPDDKLRTNLEIYAVPGNTLQLNVDERGIFTDPEVAYVQVDEALKPIKSFSLESFIYLMNNPTASDVYGLSPLETLAKTVTSDLEASSFNADFFSNNATPRFAVLMSGMGHGQASTAAKRFRTWWDEELQGKAHRPILISTDGGKIEFQRVGLNQNEMQFQEYSRWLLAKIMAVYRMQPIILGVIDSNTGKMNSAIQLELFKRHATKPLLSIFFNKLNLHAVFNYFKIKDAYISYDLDLGDKESMAKQHELYLRNGVITINQIRVNYFGWEPVEWGNVPYLQNNLSPFGASGSTVPKDNDDEAFTAPSATGKGLNRSLVKKLLAEGNGAPIGWEHLPIEKRLDVIEKLMLEREAFLHKAWSYAD